ncbi:MAG TPA: oxygenase MpaB family protein, partial [Burkholderiaceae bacterium]
MLQPEPPPDCPFGVVATAQPPVCGPVPPRPFGFAHAPAVRREIAALDARADCQRIVHLLATCEFPEDLLRSMELALFHTYGSRSVARLLDRTGEFRCRGQKRYDDTRLLIGQFIESGWDGEAGRRAIAQMNHVHAHFRIPNDDYLFVLWTLVDFPLRWTDAHGWRAFTAHERAAWFHFWRGVGERMGLRELPPTPEAFDAFARA